MILVLIVAASISSLLGSIAGVGGGILFLSLISYVVPPTALVPMHGFVQGVACFSRTIVFWKNIDWSLVKPFYLGMIPGTIISAFIVGSLVSINPNILLLLISFYVLISVFAEGKLNFIGKNTRPDILGFICGFLGMFVGSTGPIVSTWLININVIKEPHIAIKSAIQFLSHLIKIFAFVYIVGFNFQEYAFPILAMCVVSIICTYFGKLILSKLDPLIFTKSVKIILVIVSTSIAIKGLGALL